ncbi:hypothetical protein NC651_012120 [Populus alba x Populus x berolinensis]|nr:hypothetical protein NC651_012120 [Populus alba x Populus x berolinensis]
MASELTSDFSNVFRGTRMRKRPFKSHFSDLDVQKKDDIRKLKCQLRRHQRHTVKSRDGINLIFPKIAFLESGARTNLRGGCSSQISGVLASNKRDKRIEYNFQAFPSENERTTFQEQAVGIPINSAAYTARRSPLRYLPGPDGQYPQAY